MPRIPPKLILIEPRGARRELALTKVPFSIGRQPGKNELLLRDSRISREHAVIEKDNGAYVVVDGESRHGTYVNGKRIERHTLQNNDRIEFGQQTGFALIFISGASPLPELLKRVETPAGGRTPARALTNLNLLLEVGRVLQTGLALEEILTMLVDASLKVVGAERGFLFLKNEAGEVKFSTGRDRLQRTLSEQEAVSRSVIDQVVRERCDLILINSQADSRFGGQESIVNLELCSIICLPLRRMTPLHSTATTVVHDAASILGVLYLDSRKPVTAFSRVDRQMLQLLAGEASAVVDNARLFTAARAKERIEQELDIARSIQQALLPKGFKEYGYFQVTGLTLPCQQVGGDYFDLVEIPDNCYGFVVADVSGKGVAAALLTCMLQGAFSARASLGQSPERIAWHVNRFVCARAEMNRYATLFYGVLDSEGTFTYVNAGHLPPLVLHGSRTLEKLFAPAKGFPLGMFVEAEYPAAQCRLAPGDTLVFYTDGITEATNPAGEDFGLARLEKTVVEHAGASVEELSHCILDAVTAFTAGCYQADDVTLMILRYEGKP
ncbi:MAG: SpoIIE family protein phosphatase [Terriglobia bacterium]